MDEDPRCPHRKTVRIPDYDYSQPGAYFVTLVTYRRDTLLSEIVDGQTKLSRYGVIVRDAWRDLCMHHSYLRNEEFCIMPDHFHGIICLEESFIGGHMAIEGRGGEDGETCPPRGDMMATKAPISEILRGFKSFSARRINAMRHTPGVPVWMRGYHEHIISNEDELYQIRQYIIENPVKWGRKGK